MQAAIVLPSAAQCLNQIQLRERNLPVRFTLTGSAAVTRLHGMEVFDFTLSLILLGLGSNFGFLGASALVLECRGNVDERRVQAFNDFLIFAVMAVGSFLSGWILARHGWHVVLWSSFAPLAVAMAALLGTAMRSSRERS